MLALRLTQLIESHSHELANGLIDKLLSSERTLEFHKVPRAELEERVYEVYRHLSDWLLNKTESDLELQYTRLGERRAEQGVPFAQFVWAIVITKEQVWRYIQSEAMVHGAVELFGELELLRLLGQFFDRALYFTSIGYERYRSKEKTTQTKAVA